MRPVLISTAFGVVIVLTFSTIVVNGRPQAGKEYPLKLQPELDILDVETYISNPRLLKLQIQCILYDGPCDVVGKWAKREWIHFLYLFFFLN
jgi:hypothetical protein